MNPNLSLEAYGSRYGTEEDCARELYRLKWPDGFRCPDCDHRAATVIRTRRLPLYECRRCRHQTSLKVGTVMEKSKTTLRKWFLAMFWLARGVTARRLAEELQVTYKTAWLIAHKIREAIRLAESQCLLTGNVRVQEGRFGASSFASMFDRNAKRPPLIAAASVSPDGSLLHVKLHKVKSIHVHGGRLSKDVFQRFVGSKVAPQAQLHLAAGIYHAPGHPLSQFWRTASRRMNKTYFGLLPKHLQSYLDEYAYRYHISSDVSEGVQDLLKQCASHPSITYAQLIRRPAA